MSTSSFSLLILVLAALVSNCYAGVIGYCQQKTGPAIGNIPPASYEGAEKVILYEHNGYSGNSLVLCGRNDSGKGSGQTSYQDLSYLNGQVSSIKFINIKTKCVCLYELSFWAGGKKCFSVNDMKSLPSQYNDWAKSIAWSGSDCSSSV